MAVLTRTGRAGITSLQPGMLRRNGFPIRGLEQWSVAVGLGSQPRAIEPERLIVERAFGGWSASVNTVCGNWQRPLNERLRKGTSAVDYAVASHPTIAVKIEHKICERCRAGAWLSAIRCVAPSHPAMGGRPSR
jgi:hypothetical protein